MPAKPSNLDPLAERILDQLAGRPEATEIVLGGYFALQHYTQYRTTHDIDAWWKSRPTSATEQVIREGMRAVADENGDELIERRFGETLSFELRRAGKRRFSFQIAVRSVEIDEPILSAWPPVLLETLRDNIGAKMNALVDRGAPRDYLDIRHIADQNLTTAEECWKLWSAKNPGQSVAAAKEKVLFHLDALDLRRPLSAITDPQERKRAQETRDWFRTQFVTEDK